MEADWEAEVGAGLPVIDADWAGYVDLRSDGGAIGSIAEAVADSALREVLCELNGPQSPMFTSKCDVWGLGAEEIDPAEFDCSVAEARVGRASYVDVIARDDEVFRAFEKHEAWVRRATEHLRMQLSSHGRVDLVVRAALAREREGFGITVYAAGCGVDTQSAQRAWEQILRAAVTITMSEAPDGTGE